MRIHSFGMILVLVFLCSNIGTAEVRSSNIADSLIVQAIDQSQDLVKKFDATSKVEYLDQSLDKLTFATEELIGWHEVQLRKATALANRGSATGDSEMLSAAIDLESIANALLQLHQQAICSAKNAIASRLAGGGSQERARQIYEGVLKNYTEVRYRRCIEEASSLLREIQ